MVHPDEIVRIDTPEQVTLELPIAGVGSRFLAIALDTLLQLLLVVATLIALRLLSVPLRAVSVGPAVGVLLVFCIYWGYYAALEIGWSGRTPGKRVAGIRVIDESGRPVTVYGAIARNVLRAIDFLPGFYAAGVLVMMLNRRSRRIGDFVAGTIVVYDLAIDPTVSELPAPASRGDRRALPALTPDDVALVETYLARRFDLDMLVREQMGEQILRRIEQKTGLVHDDGHSVDELLEALVRQARDAARFR